MSGMKSVSTHEEASGGGGRYSRQGGLIAQQNVTICFSKTTYPAICTNLGLA